MVRFASFAALMLVAAPAFADVVAPAQPPAPLHRGQILRDMDGARLGAIDSVATDGSIGLIVDGRYVRLPASAVSNVDGKPQTSMSRKDIKARR